MVNSIIMFVVSSLFTVFSYLIHDYHQSKVTDKSTYGKAFVKAMTLMAGAMAVFSDFRYNIHP